MSSYYEPRCPVCRAEGGKPRANTSNKNTCPRHLLAEVERLREEIVRRHGIAAEMIAARRERDEAKVTIERLEEEILKWFTGRSTFPYTLAREAERIAKKREGK